MTIGKTPKPSSCKQPPLAPSDSREAATVAWPIPGAYTAIVQGKGGQTGVGLIEVYSLQ